MDQQYIKEHQLVERFVLNQLSGQELDEFLVYQMMHPEIQTAIEEERGRMKSVRALQHPDVKKPAVSLKWWWWGGTALVIFFTALFFINGNDVGVRPPSNNGNIELPNEENPVQGKMPKTEENEVEKIKDRPIAKTNNDASPKNKPDENKPTKLMAANFDPNPALELLLDNPVRSNSFKMEIESPKKDAEIKIKNGKITFPLSGIIKSINGGTTDKKFQAYLFSNKKEDYEKFQPIWQSDLTIDETEADFSFSTTINLSVVPGLYYYLIEDENGDQLYAIGRIQMK